MWSPRAQCDKTRFSAEWRRELENTQNLYIWQDTAAELLFDTTGERPRATGVRTCMGVVFTARAVILTAGTFLDGMMYCGDARTPGGPGPATPPRRASPRRSPPWDSRRGA